MGFRNSSNSLLYHITQPSTFHAIQADSLRPKIDTGMRRRLLWGTAPGMSYLSLTYPHIAEYRLS